MHSVSARIGFIGASREQSSGTRPTDVTPL
jgi:hypothetical protein